VSEAVASEAQAAPQPIAENRAVRPKACPRRLVGVLAADLSTTSRSGRGARQRCHAVIHFLCRSSLGGDLQEPRSGSKNPGRAPRTPVGLSPGSPGRAPQEPRSGSPPQEPRSGSPRSGSPGSGSPPVGLPKNPGRALPKNPGRALPADRGVPCAMSHHHHTVILERFGHYKFAEHCHNTLAALRKHCDAPGRGSRDWDRGSGLKPTSAHDHGV